MPIPQTAPSLVGPFLYDVVSSINGNPGPYALTGNTWLFTTATSGNSASELAVYKSTDGGISYGIPITDSITVFSKNCCAVSWDGSNTAPIFAYVDANDGLIKFVPFDTSVLGGTYQGGRASAVSPLGGGAAVGNLWCVNFGLHVYIGWDDNAGLHLLYYNSSSFQIVTDIPSAGDEILPMSAASSSKCGVWSRDSAAVGDGGSGSYFYTIFNGATLVSTSTALTLPDSDNRVANRTQTCAYYDSGSDSSVLPLPMFLHSTGAGFHALLIASPSGLAPAFTLKTVTSFNSTDTTGYPWLTGAFTLFWQRTRASDGEVLVEFSTCATLTGTWAAAKLFWDQQAFEPSPAPSAQGIFPLTANYISGKIGVLVGLTETISSPTNTFTDVLFTWQPIVLAPTTSLRLLTVVSGGTAIPSQFILNANGPQLLAGAGDTGVVSVIPGSYALSVSAGPFGYTPGTYSSVKNGGAPIIANLVTINSGDVVVSTVTETFTNTPFPPPSFCIAYDNNPGGTPTFVAYDEPQEIQGS